MLATAADSVLVITSIGGVITGIIASIYAGKATNASRANGANIEQVHHEVKTLNGLTLGRMADNTETRRINELPESKRSNEEKLHIIVVPEPGQPSPKETET